MQEPRLEPDFGEVFAKDDLGEQYDWLVGAERRRAGKLRADSSGQSPCAAAAVALAGHS